jgi:glycerol-3-phosphate dehydrogenase
MIYDLFIIGGGINGCGIARDAAGRGLKVFLAEQGDLASGTSSASTKLIHGGLRYLEHYEFRLVREALIEREVLLKSAPHIIWPLRFVLPHHQGLRPWPCCASASFSMITSAAARFCRRRAASICAPTWWGSR